MHIPSRQNAPRGRRKGLKLLKAIVNLDLQPPLLEQPFRYIATIAIGLAPLLQFGRGRVFLLREAQAFDEEFKLGRTLGDVGCNVTPIGISASAHYSLEMLTDRMILVLLRFVSFYTTCRHRIAFCGKLSAWRNPAFCGCRLVQSVSLPVL